MDNPSSTEESPNMVSMPAEQFSEMMRMMQELSKKADLLQSELDALKASKGGVADLVESAERQEAVMHTVRRATQARETFRQMRLEDVRPHLDLAADAAILDFKKNPPKWKA